MKKVYQFEVTYSHGKRGESKVVDYTVMTSIAQTEKEAIKEVKKSVRDLWKYENHVFGKISPSLLKTMTMQEYVVSMNPNR